jgi:hypothetical protein
VAASTLQAQQEGGGKVVFSASFTVLLRHVEILYYFNKISRLRLNFLNVLELKDNLASSRIINAYILEVKNVGSFLNR